MSEKYVLKILEFFFRTCWIFSHHQTKKEKKKEREKEIRREIIKFRLKLITRGNKLESTGTCGSCRDKYQSKEIEANAEPALFSNFLLFYWENC